ncbi:hypothetical protein [Sphingomonas sp. BK580]|uniref:hypothetical protein n=1 Tax=Sphingomonas sp. BK580 TaxID=2586972 RepID=UPI001618092F|nr:hypothetical protein [Sphingomonas sp. BK580]MBB3691490.1 hypothetical protein [Sphingomonas sp. BK580]
MTVTREMRLRHVSDIARGDGVVFGGDSMGHWNVDRINRILDAMEAPTRQLSLPPAAMHGMAMVGAPDPVKVEAYVRMGLSHMPPLTFVSLDEPEKQAGSIIRTMLVDGHHRMAALFVMGVGSVPARVLPRELERDVRVVELSEVAIFPEPQVLNNEIELGRWRA